MTAMRFVRTEPVRLTRANLAGHTFRIGKVYGASPMGIRVYLSYHASKGCNDALMSGVLMRAIRERVPAMANVGGERCSRRWYERRAMTVRDRDLAELRARRDRGEKFEAFYVRQAS